MFRLDFDVMLLEIIGVSDSSHPLLSIEMIRRPSSVHVIDRWQAAVCVVGGWSVRSLRFSDSMVISVGIELSLKICLILEV